MFLKGRSDRLKRSWLLRPSHPSPAGPGRKFELFSNPGIVLQHPTLGGQGKPHGRGDMDQHEGEPVRRSLDDEIGVPGVELFPPLPLKHRLDHSGKDTA